MTPTERLLAELSTVARTQLDAAHPRAVRRYAHYRRRGALPGAAFDQALAWGRNTAAEQERSVSHETGAEL